MTEVRTNESGAPLLVPDTVTVDELREALMPLCALLNITQEHIFDIPGITIGHEAITFVAPSPKVAEDWAKTRPPANVTTLGLQAKKAGVGELAQVVHVRIVDGVEVLG